jgi:hypothetical protein
MTLEESEKKVDKRHVERRIRDWKKRLAGLYAMVRGWLKDTEYNLAATKPLRMYEKMMYDFDIPETEMESVDVRKNGLYICALVPRGLWTVGANGFVEILNRKDRYDLVDVSKPFESPQWKIVSFKNPDGELFTKENFLAILSDLA